MYGTANSGGSFGSGSVFALNTDGSGFTNLYSFTKGTKLYNPTTGASLETNADGVTPSGGLVQRGGTLYGVASSGGTFGAGTVFRLNTDGSGFQNLHTFPAPAEPVPFTFVFTNSEGAFPSAGLALSGATLYGVTSSGGPAGSGVIFKINSDGGQFTRLYSFTAKDRLISTNRDGASPAGRLMSYGAELYGTAPIGGLSGDGTVFQINANGTGFTVLHNFSGGTDGAGPEAGLILSGNTALGTAWSGGNANNGTLFSLSLPAVSAPPPLAMALSGPQLTLSWPANAIGFRLQTNADLAPNHWSAYAGVVTTNGSILSSAISNPVGNLFFRLIKP